MLVLLAESVKKDILANSSNSTWKLVGLILLCVIIIVACYYTTRFIGRKSQGVQVSGGKNIKAIETMRVTQNKYLQLVKCGDKYLLISVTKDNISLISEIDGDSIITEKSGNGPHKSFKEIITSFTAKGKADKKGISEIATKDLEQIEDDEDDALEFADDASREAAEACEEVSEEVPDEAAEVCEEVSEEVPDEAAVDRDTPEDEETDSVSDDHKNN